MVLNGTAPWWLEASIARSEYIENLASIQREKRKIRGHPHIANRVLIKNIATCDTNDSMDIYVDASCRRHLGIGLLIEKDGNRTEEMLWIAEKLETSRTEMIAVLAAATKPEAANVNMTIYTDRLNIAERFKKGQITNNLEAKLWTIMEERSDQGLVLKVKWRHRGDVNMRRVDTLARVVVQGQGNRTDELFDKFLYKCKKLRRSDKYAKIMEQ